MAYKQGGSQSPLTTKGDLLTYSTVDARLGVGANGTLLTADSSAATGNKWTTATFPATATGTGKILRADGTNFVVSTATYPDTATGTGKVLRADGTNWAASTATYPDTATGTGTILRADGTNWSATTATYPATAVAGDLIYSSATNVVGSLAISALPGAVLVASDSSLPSWNKATGGPDIVYFEDDFLYFSTTAQFYTPWEQNKTGTGAASKIGTPVATNPGIHTLTTGTDTTGEADLLRGISDGTTLTNVLLGGGYHEFKFICNLTTLSTAGEEYAIYFGLGDGLQIFNTHPGSNCCVFEYIRGTSTNWLGVTKKAGSATTASGGSNVAVGTGWTLFRMTINAAATSVSFYVNGTLIGTSTTNIPNTVPVGLGFVIKKSAGNTSRTMDIDYASWYHKLTTSRF